YYYTLKTHERRYAWLSRGWNVGYFGSAVKPVQGFAGYKANRPLANSLVVGVENIGQGSVVYFVDNPLFRNFWQDGKMLFANAVFIAGE
ncbi:MAG: zinc carboxypeptidase, partial [Bacteroidota bacterium]|nr:zinc carboxypeptidase [Bacteroidota bacterium]